MTEKDANKGGLRVGHTPFSSDAGRPDRMMLQDDGRACGIAST